MKADKEKLREKARQLRVETIEMLYKAQSGHPGSALSTMDVLTTLFFGGVLKHNPKKTKDMNYDHFILSNGHACPALYAVLADRGYFSKSELNKLRQLGAGAQGHPHRGSLPGIEISAGSLGQGLSVGIGLACGLKLKKDRGMVYVMMSDGEQEEGSTWEAIMYAPKKKLDNLVAIVDKNNYQIDGATKEVMPNLDPLSEKYSAFGWYVQEINGHDFGEIYRALLKAKTIKKPVVIIANTVRGKGVSYMENSEHWHAGAISEGEYEKAKSDLSV